ncbi:MAG: hypothetical protein ACR2JJ_04150 [Sphingomicrobium sp.]
MFLRVSIAFGALSFSVPSVAAQAERSMPQVIDQIAACQSVADPEARLACFDDSVRRLTTATTSGDIVVLDREQVRKTRRSLFGFSLPKLPFFGNADDPDGEAIKEIESTIARTSVIGHRRWALHLDDGTVWNTTEIVRRVDPSPGAKIKIRAAALGSYRAEIESSGTVGVQRVR